MLLWQIFICVDGTEITRYAILHSLLSHVPSSGIRSPSASSAFHTVDPHRPLSNISPSQHVRVQRLSSARKDRPYHRGKLWYRQGEFHPIAWKDVASSSTPPSSITGNLKATAILFAKVGVSPPQLLPVTLKHTPDRVVRTSFSLHAERMPCKT